MAVVYDLWDVEAGNLIGLFQTEAEALAVVRDLLEVNTPDYATALSLGYRDEQGKRGLVAEGTSLAKLAQTANLKSA